MEVFSKTSWLMLLLSVTFMLNVYPQGTNKVAGRVVDATTGEPLPGAAIQIENSTVGTSTDRDGNFALSNIREEHSYRAIYDE